MIKLIKKCTLEDLELLCEISRETFYQTFADSNSAENMQAYLDCAYNEEKLAELIKTMKAEIAAEKKKAKQA